MANILVVEDRDDERASITETLQEHHHQVFEAADVESAKQMLSQTGIDIALVDMRMPLSNRTTRVTPKAGLAVIDHAVQRAPTLVCIVITAYGSTENLVDAIQRGAWDYIEKPFSENRLFHSIDSALRQREFERSNPNIEGYRRERLIGGSEKMMACHHLINRVSQSDVDVLILGEPGTGKDLVARAIHYDSARCRGEFNVTNCSAIPSELLEDELFGHKKGAFMGADVDRPGAFGAAEGGTIFLDEIGDMPVKLQPKLLRTVREKLIKRVGDDSERPIDVRIIAATNQDLEQAVISGNFRRDLYDRLNVISITVPPLRERKDDIPLLIAHFLKKHSGTPPLTVSEETMNLLMRYEWPGNVAELENVTVRAITLASDTIIHPSDLPLGLQSGATVIEPVPNDEPKPQRDEPQKTLYQSFKRLVELGNDWNTITNYLVVAAMAETEVDARAAALIGRPDNTVRDRKPSLKEIVLRGTNEGKLAEQLGNLRTPQQRKRLLEKFPINTEPR
jgi:two-component system, NtrC family, response regulator PilR